MKKLSILLLLCGVCALQSHVASAQWMQTGGPNAGNVTSLVVFGNKLFAGTFAGGVFVTANNGNTWDAVNTGLDNPIVTSLAATSTHLFAGTAGGGVYASSDEGASWTATNTDLTNTDINAVITVGTNVFAGTNDGVFLSTDNGSTWIAKNEGLSSTSISSFATQHDTLFVGTLTGVYRSLDLGSTWTISSTGITSFAITTMSSADEYLFAATSTEIFYSINNGALWHTSGLPSHTFVSSVVGDGIMSGSHHFVGTVGDGVFRFNRFTGSWLEVNEGLSNLDVRALAVAGGTSGNIFAATYGAGVWVRPIVEIVPLSVEEDPFAPSPSDMRIESTYPNPVSDVATIRFSIMQGGPVSIDVVNACNTAVFVVANEVMHHGTYTATVDTKGLPNGVYYCRVLSNGRVSSKQMVVLR